MIDPVIRDDIMRAHSEGTAARQQEWVEARAEDLLDDVDEVEDLIRYSNSGLLAQALAMVMVELSRIRQRTCAQDIALDLLRVLAREEVECRMRDGE
jgi:hypothetical protein